MDFISGLQHWGLFGGGSAIALTGVYVLGRADALRKVRQNRPTWVAVSDHGPFGLEPAEFFRSRSSAESYRRRLVGTEQINVMSCDEWLDEMVRRLKSDDYWDEFERIERWNEGANARIRSANQAPTTVLSLPAEPSATGEIVPRLDAILNGLTTLSNQVGNTEDSLAESMRLMDAFREHIVHLDETVTAHTKNVGHVTAEMKAITEDVEEPSTDRNAPKFSSPTGPTLVRTPRGVVRIGRELEKNRSDNESGPETVEG
jgi:hypothetical protein